MNNMIDQTLLKYPFHESNHRTGEFKPFSYDDGKTLTEDNIGIQKYHHQQQQDITSLLNNNINNNNSNNNNNNNNNNANIKKLSSNSLVANSLKNNSYSSMNGGKTFRKQNNNSINNINSSNSNSHLTSDISSATATAANNVASGMNQVSANQITSTTTLNGGVNRRGQHYITNISLASNNKNPGLIGSHKQQQPLLNLSLLESSVNAQTSPINVVNESSTSNAAGGQQPMLSTHQTVNHHHHHPHLSSSVFDTINNPIFCSGNLCRNGIGELLASLALMCILSLLMAFLALFFIQRSYSIPFSGSGDHSTNIYSNVNISTKHRISTMNQFNQRIVSNSKEYMKVFQISVSLSTLTIALDLCCLFVCCIQFLSIIKLLKTPFGVRRSFEFIKKTSHIRVISIGAFLVSIPIFFTGVILYTFVNFDEIPALITSIIIGIGIIFCGIASVQNVYLWQWEKTKASQDMHLSHRQQQQQQQQHLQQFPSHHQHQPQQSSFIFNEQTTSGNALYPLELSTLV